MKKQVLHIGQQSVYSYDPWKKGTHKRNTTKMKYLILIGREMKYLILVGREDPKSLEVLMSEDIDQSLGRQRKPEFARQSMRQGTILRKSFRNLQETPFESSIKY